MTDTPNVEATVSRTMEEHGLNGLKSTAAIAWALRVVVCTRLIPWDSALFASDEVIDARTAAVCLLAKALNDDVERALKIVHGLPSASYTTRPDQPSQEAPQ